MAENYFELCGRLGWVNATTTEKGYFITKITLGVKKNEKEWDNYFVTFIDAPTSKDMIAQRIYEKKKKGDYIRVKGYHQIDKFTPKGSDKEVQNISLIGTYFCGIKWNQFEKGYVDDVS